MKSLLDLAETAQERGTIRGILFHQGETNTAQDDWKYAVEGIVADLRSDLGIGEVPFLAGEMLHEERGGCCGSHNAEVAKLPDLIPDAHVVSAEGLEGQDYAHFTAEAYRELGRRYAEETLEHVEFDDGTSTPTPTPEPGTGSDDGPSFPQGATDPDGDGDYEDLNGNGRVDYQDVVTYFEEMDDERMRADARYYDYDDDGRIDYTDLVSLFRSVE